MTKRASLTERRCSIYHHALGRNQFSNREFHLLEPLANRRKQTREVRSNREFFRGSLSAITVPFPDSALRLLTSIPHSLEASNPHTGTNKP